VLHPQELGGCDQWYEMRCRQRNQPLGCVVQGWFTGPLDKVTGADALCHPFQGPFVWV
jgi:hypothetical protein